MNINDRHSGFLSIWNRVCAITAIALVTLAVNSASADILHGTTQTTFASGGTPVDLMLDIDTVAGTVNIEITGRSDGWFAVGFGNTVMANTYGILALQDGSIEERKLDYTGGTVLTPEVNILSNTVSGSLRTVMMERDMTIADADYFSFPTIESTVPLISASAAGAFGYHGADNRSPNSIDLVAVPEPGSLAALALMAIGTMVIRRRR